jgi:hypothetical protein
MQTCRLCFTCHAMGTPCAAMEMPTLVRKELRKVDVDGIRFTVEQANGSPWIISYPPVGSPRYVDHTSKLGRRVLAALG